MRFLQFYYALPIAMVVLSVTLVPFFHRAKVYTAYEYPGARFDAKTRALTSFLFLVSRSMSLGVVISAPAVVLAVVLGLERDDHRRSLIALPTAVYTMFGGVQAVTWTDVKQMVLIVGGLVAAVVVLMLACRTTSASSTALRLAGRDRPAADVRLLLRSHQPVHVLVGNHRGVLPLLLLLRHRPEPGAALPDDQVGRRGAQLAADERLLEDSAPGAGAARRRADVRLLRVHAVADAVQRRARARDARGSARRRVRRSGAQLRGGVGGPRGGSDGDGCGPISGGDAPLRGRRTGRQFKAREAEVRDDSRRGADARARDDRRRAPTAT